MQNGEANAPSRRVTGDRGRARGAIAIEVALLGAVILSAALLTTEGIGAVWRTGSPVRMGLLGLMCSLGTLCWYALYRRRTKSRLARRDGAEGTVSLDRAAIFAKRHEILGILAADTEMLFETGMRVQHVMSVHVTSVEPARAASSVQGLMREHDIRHVLVCERGQQLIGIISDRDLKKPGRTARDLMTPSPITTQPSALISPAITQMIQRRISCLPVVLGDRVVGVLTSTA
jgi:acetoin utilization protein AcuB